MNTTSPVSALTTSTQLTELNAAAELLDLQVTTNRWGDPRIVAGDHAFAAAFSDDSLYLSMLKGNESQAVEGTIRLKGALLTSETIASVIAAHL